LSLAFARSAAVLFEGLPGLCCSANIHRVPTYPYNAEIGQTDLMGAAYNGDAEEVALILSMPCDVDAQDNHGVSALMYAAMEGHTAAVQRLIEHGADMELQASSQRYTALMYAVRGAESSGKPNVDWATGGFRDDIWNADVMRER